MQHSAKFFVGQLVHHKRFGYRGVVFDVDATFQGTDEWYERMAPSCPPKAARWYYVLVDEADHTTYVAEPDLDPDILGVPVEHPLVDLFFERFERGRHTRTIN